ncbi:hypothetical protein R1flu_001753 [Riccia fluitans]|uniref:Uncharacterized protein n=1 Tax=Riccia fluitans TaxID=41844 RepID=A0ABD1Y463_9MARC
MVRMVDGLACKAEKKEKVLHEREQGDFYHGTSGERWGNSGEKSRGRREEGVPTEGRGGFWQLRGSMMFLPKAGSVDPNCGLWSLLVLAPAIRREKNCSWSRGTDTGKAGTELCLLRFLLLRADFSPHASFFVPAAILIPDLPCRSSSA